MKTQSVNICYTYVDIQHLCMSSYRPVFLNVLGAGSVTIPVLGVLGKERIGERIAEWRKVKGGMGKKE